jgi:5S rRNA maturation endonuclease (ribonuclease M5)
MVDNSRPPYDKLLDALREHGGTVKDSGSQTMAQCPAHDDGKPSLHITATESRTLVYCHAGCDTADVLAALGLTMADLYPNARSGVYARYLYPGGSRSTRKADKKFSQTVTKGDRTLFHADQIGEATTVYVVEGEEDVYAVESKGRKAVSPRQGAATPADRWDWSPLKGKDVIVVADRDDAGRKHADDVMAQVEPIAKRIWLREPAVGKDISDHIAAGRTLHELAEPSLLDKISVTGDWLNKQKFAALEYVVPGLICEGLGMLVAPPKKGKSFLVGNLAVAVASGGRALGCIEVRKRPVLVLALEDGHRRLQDRYTQINDGQPIPANIRFITKATPAECTTVIAEFLNRHRDDKPLVILDTLGKVKRPKRSGEESYQLDYATGTEFKNLADSVPGSTILVIHHTRKADAADFIDLVSGTQGLAGSVDYVLALDRKRHQNEAILSVTGRDIIEAEYALIADSGFLWRLDGDSLTTAADRADERREQAAKFAGLDKRSVAAVRLIEQRGRVTAAQVAIKFNTPQKRASELLMRLAKHGVIVRLSHGEYGPLGSNTTADIADSADLEGFADLRVPSPPGISAKSEISAESATSVKSASVGNTCDCGAPLTQQTSRDRGVCLECWASRDDTGGPLIETR